MTCNSNLKTTAWLLSIAIVALWQINSSSAWLSSTSGRALSSWSIIRQQKQPQHMRQKNTQLFYKSSQDPFASSSFENEPASYLIRRRASIEGVSLAPQGFWAMLRIAQDGYIPWQVTDDPQDAHAATSAEALTLIQLLSGVDMAGAILPPDVLARLVILHCEELVSSSSSASPDLAAKEEGNDNQVDVAKDILLFVQDSLPNATVSYSEVHPWAQSRVRLPTASLDEVLVDAEQNTFVLTCSVRDFGTISFTPTNDMLQSVLYQFSPETSLAFTSLALALRYQAPVNVMLMQQEGDGICLEALQRNFPMYATVASLQQSSNRVQENIVRGFEIHKLQGALRIAMERGDHQAAAKIREALDEYDSMDQLPTANFEQEDGGLQRNCTMGDVMQ